MHAGLWRCGGLALTAGVQWMNTRFLIVAGEEVKTMQFSKGKMMKELEKRLGARAVQLKEEEAWKDLNVFKSLMEGKKETVSLSGAHDRAGVNGHKLKFVVFHMNTRRTFIVRVAQHWNKIYRESEEYPLLEIFRTRLDIVLDNLLVDNSTSTGGLYQMPDSLKKSLQTPAIL